MSDKITEELWRRGYMEFLLHDKQKEVYDKILKSDYQIHLVFCSRQWGKSFLSLALANHYIQNPNIKNKLAKVAAGTLKAADDIVNDNMKIFTQTAPPDFVQRQKSDKRFKLGVGELRLGMMDKSHVDSLRGGNAGIFICDEAAAAVSSEDFEYAYKGIIMPQLLRSGGKLIIVTTPSKNPDHIIHTNILDQCKRNGTFYTYTIYDNPQLTKEQIDKAIEAYGGVDNIDFRREYLCEVVRDGRSLITPAYSEIKHLTKDGYSEIYADSCWISGDVGGIRDKHVLQVWGQRISDHKLMIIDERVHESNTNTLVLGNEIKYLMKKYRVKSHHVFIDCHGQTQVDFSNLCGITVTLPPKVDRDNAIMALNSAFFSDRILINENCVFTRKSLRSCMFNSSRTDFERTEELGHADGVMTAVYGLRVEKFIERPLILTNFNLNHQINFNKNNGKYDKLSKILNPFGSK